MRIRVGADTLSATARAVQIDRYDGTDSQVEERMAVNPHLIPHEDAWGPWAPIEANPNEAIGETGLEKVFDPPHPIVVQWRDAAGANTPVPYRGIPFPQGALLPGETLAISTYEDSGVSIGNQLYGSLPAGATVHFLAETYPDAGDGTREWSVFPTASTPPQVALGSINPNTGYYQAPTAEAVRYQRIPIGIRVGFQQLFPPAQLLTDEISFVLDIPKPASAEGFTDIGARLPDAPYRWNFPPPNLPLLVGLTGRARDPGQNAFSDVRTIFLKSFRYGLVSLSSRGDIQMRLAHSASGAATELILDRDDDLGWAIQANSDLSIVARWQFGPEQAGFTDSTVDPDNPTAANFDNAALHTAFSAFTQHLTTNPNAHILLLWDPAGLPAPIPNPRTGQAMIGSPAAITDGFRWNRSSAPVVLGRLAVNGAFRTLMDLQLQASTNFLSSVNQVQINLGKDPDLVSTDADVEDESTFGFRITRVGDPDNTFGWQIGGDSNNQNPYTLSNQGSNYLNGERHALLRTFLENATANGEYILEWSKDGIPPLLGAGKPAWTGQHQIARLWTSDVEIARLWNDRQLVFERGTLS